jgi:hypothetical protein
MSDEISTGQGFLTAAQNVMSALQMAFSDMQSPEYDNAFHLAIIEYLSMIARDSADRPEYLKFTLRNAETGKAVAVRLIVETVKEETDGNE